MTPPEAIATASISDTERAASLEKTAARKGIKTMSYLARMRRDHQVRSVDLTFRQTITEEEYAEMAEAANYRPCPYCGDEFRFTLQSYPGPMTKLGDRYCTERCVRASERKNAPYGVPPKTEDENPNTDPALIGWR